MAGKVDFGIAVVQTAPSPATSGDSLVLESGHGARLPAAPFYATAVPDGEMATLDNAEKILVTAKSTDTLTITRAQAPTGAKSIAAGWVLINAFYADDIPETFDDLTDGATNKAYTSTEKTKLSGIATGANVVGAASSSDSELPAFNGTNGKTLKATNIGLVDYGAGGVGLVPLVGDFYIGDTITGTDHYVIVKAPQINLEAGPGGVLITGSSTNQLRANKVDEATSAAGVTIDGVLIKDGLVDSVDVSTLSGWTSKTAPTGTVLGTTDTQTLTNKRVDPRVYTTASATSVTPTVATYDQYCYTALAANLTINSVGGTPVNGSKLLFRIKDNGTSRTLTWNAVFRAVGVTIPTATVVSKVMYIGAVYNAAETKWDVIAVSQEA